MQNYKAEIFTFVFDKFKASVVNIVFSLFMFSIFAALFKIAFLMQLLYTFHHTVIYLKAAL